MKESVIYQEILAEGRQEATEQIALNLLRSGINIEDVANLTNLSVEQIQILQSRMDSKEKE